MMDDVIDLLLRRRPAMAKYRSMDRDTLLNVIELFQEDLDVVHAWLDEQGAPKRDEHTGKTYSIVGRIKALQRRKKGETK